MKKAITGIILTVLVSLFLAVSTFGATNRTEIGVIITVDHANDYWEVLDTNGDVWYFYNGEDLEIGNLVKVRFATFGTLTKYDDEIVDIFCIGYVENIKDFF